MLLDTYQNFFPNFCFACLFSSMLFYITYLVFPKFKNAQKLGQISSIFANLILFFILSSPMLITRSGLCFASASPSILSALAYSASSFNTAAAKVLMQRGEDAARKALPELVSMRDSLGLEPVIKTPHKLPDTHSPVFVKRIDVEGTDKINIESILGKIGIGKDKCKSGSDQ